MEMRAKKRLQYKTMVNPKFQKILDEMAELHSNKNSNYASKEDFLSNFKRVERIGISPLKSCIVRMSDKWERIMNLLGGEKDNVGESVRDTLIDLAVYSIIAILLIEEQKNDNNN